jgi:hypothetical protein
MFLQPKANSYHGLLGITGRENLRDVKQNDFELCRDGQGRKYVSVKVQRQTKNHRGDNLTDDNSKDGRKIILFNISKVFSSSITKVKQILEEHPFFGGFLECHMNKSDDCKVFVSPQVK